ncbi:MAG: hypothetical protein WCF67_21550 [Chitinophagaceae bacterium]
MPLPVGNWKININGTEGELPIVSPPDQQGKFSGVVMGKNFQGFWDETSQTVTINVKVGEFDNFPTIYLLKGYLFRTPANAEPGRDVIVTLSGYVQTQLGPGYLGVANSSFRRNIFGWFAQIQEVQ